MEQQAPLVIGEAGKKNIWSAYQAYSQQWTTQQREDYTIEKQEQKEKLRRMERQQKKSKKRNF